MYRINDPRLKVKTLPVACVPIWNTFWALSNTRQVSATGSLQPITYAEIAAYASLMQITFEPYEVDMFKRMDLAYLSKLNTTKDK